MANGSKTVRPGGGGVFSTLNKLLFGGVQEKSKKIGADTATGLINMHKKKPANATGAKRIKQ